MISLCQCATDHRVCILHILERFLIKAYVCAGQRLSCCEIFFAVFTRFGLFLQLPCDKRKAIASCSRGYSVTFVRQIHGKNGSRRSLSLRASCANCAGIVRLPCSCLVISIPRPEIASKMNMLKIRHATLRQPCGLAIHKTSFWLPHEALKNVVVDRCSAAARVM